MMKKKMPPLKHEILRAFRTLLDSESDRFQPSAWQKFIQQLNTWNMEDVDQITLAAVCNCYRSAISFIKLCFFAGRAFELAFV